MKDLQYRIGGLDIDPEKFVFTGDIPHKADYRFVVAVADGTAEFYAAAFGRHVKLASHFGLGEPDAANFGSWLGIDEVEATAIQ